MLRTIDNEVLHEIELLKSIAAGDRAAFRQVYDRHSPALFSLAFEISGDREDAEEILQDTFLKIWLHAGDFDARLSRPFTWTVTILRRTALDRLRRRTRSPQTYSVEDPAHKPQELASPETARQHVESAERLAQLRQLLTSFERPHRAALELSLFSNRSPSEIAATLGTPLGTVKTWLRRGLHDLRHLFRKTQL